MDKVEFKFRSYIRYHVSDDTGDRLVLFVPWSVTSERAIKISARGWEHMCFRQMASLFRRWTSRRSLSISSPPPQQMLKHAELVGALDCGTTSVSRSLGTPDRTTDPCFSSARFIVFNRHAEIIALHQVEFPQYYPHPGFVLSHYDGSDH